MTELTVLMPQRNFNRNHANGWKYVREKDVQMNREHRARMLPGQCEGASNPLTASVEFAPRRTDDEMGPSGEAIRTAMHFMPTTARDFGSRDL